MRHARPYYLNLRQIHLPIGGLVSILHRASGALLALAIPGLVFLLSLSLQSAADFERIKQGIQHPVGWLLVVGLTWSFLHHFFAGLRHLGFDIGWGESKTVARKTAWLSLFAAVVLTGLMAVGSGGGWGP